MVNSNKTVKELVIDKLGEVMCMLNSMKLQIEDAMAVKESKSKNILLNDILNSTLSLDRINHSHSAMYELESIVIAIDKNLAQNEQAKKTYVNNTLAEFGFTDPDSQNVVDVHDPSPDFSTFSESKTDDKKVKKPRIKNKVDISKKSKAVEKKDTAS